MCVKVYFQLIMKRLRSCISPMSIEVDNGRKTSKCSENAKSVRSAFERFFSHIERVEIFVLPMHFRRRNDNRKLSLAFNNFVPTSHFLSHSIFQSS